MRTHALLGAAVAAVAGLLCGQDQREILRAHVLRTAQRYATFEWRAGDANVLHGDDPDGVRVDTPDSTFDAAGWLADGSVNRGMPYAWGGFSSVEEFTAGIAQGGPAGNVPTSERARASRFALGVDCSGYVSRCFDLPVKQSTRSLALLCHPLADYAELLPGDLLNQHDSHVALFVGWTDATKQHLRVLEAARLGVRESIYEARAAWHDGFRPLRYRLLDARWRAMDAGALGRPSWRRPPAAGAAHFAAASEPAAPEADAHPLARAAVDTWVTYSAALGTPAAATTSRTLFAAGETDGRIDLQCSETIDGKLLPTGVRVARDQPASAALADLLAFHEPLVIQRVVGHEAHAGTCTHGNRRFRARRHTWQFAGTTTVRHVDYPLWLDATVVFADDVPLYGVVTAEFELAVDWRRSGRRDAAMVHRLTLTLAAFGTAP
jgi:hypothetical protein